jgi:hydroxyethylthiazole kinase-like uncharacterized protein yjeF
MREFNFEELKKLYVPDLASHKGQNGKVLIIAGSKLFHAASLWPLIVASRMADMVFYSSVPENNELVAKAKEEFRNGIVVPRSKLDQYVNEADAILIGPGLPRKEGAEEGDEDTKELTESLLARFTEKKWVIDGGSLQTINPEILLKLKTTPILTPHKGEYEKLFEGQKIEEMAKKYRCVILLKGQVDLVSSPTESVQISGGNPGMTKGGTGDVLAGLVISLYAKNDAFLSACAGSYINKKAGENLEKKMGLYFNALDLSDEIPKVLKKILG